MSRATPDTWPVTKQNLSSNLGKVAAFVEQSNGAIQSFLRAEDRFEVYFRS